MKTVFTNTELFHVWANQKQESGRTSKGSIFFEGAVIYSYGRHFPMAAVTDIMVNSDYSMGSPKPALFITNRKYSRTTDKHLWKVRRATTQFTMVYCNDPAEAVRGYHTMNLEAFENQAKAIFNTITPRTRTPWKQYGEIKRVWSAAVTYCQVCGLVPAKALKKFKFMHLTLPSELEAKERAYNIRQRELEATRMERQAAKLVIDIQEFHEFKRSGVNTNDGLAYLRFNPIQSEIQTSKGIKVPVDEAHKMYRYVRAAIKKGGCTDCNYSIQGYGVRRIDQQYIEVGCHTIPMAEVDNVARQLNWK